MIRGHLLFLTTILCFSLHAHAEIACKRLLGAGQSKAASIIEHSSGNITAVATSHSGDRFAIASLQDSDGKHASFPSIKVFHRDGKLLAHVALEEKNFVSALEFHPDGDSIAAGDTAGTITLMHLSNPHLLSKSAAPKEKPVATNDNILIRSTSNDEITILNFTQKDIIIGTKKGGLHKAGFRFHNGRPHLEPQRRIIESPPKGERAQMARLIEASGLVLTAGESDVLIQDHKLLGGKLERETTGSFAALSKKSTSETVTAISKISPNLIATAGNYGTIQLFDVERRALLDWRFSVPTLKKFIENEEAREPRTVIKEVLYSEKHGILLAVGMDVIRVNRFGYARRQGLRFIAIDMLRKTVIRNWTEFADRTLADLESTPFQMLRLPLRLSADRSTLYASSISGNEVYEYDVQKLFDYAASLDDQPPLNLPN